jgi:hypothetical protein
MRNGVLFQPLTEEKAYDGSSARTTKDSIARLLSVRSK